MFHSVGTWNWTVKFDIRTLPADSSVVLSVSLAGYSSGVSSSILLNNVTKVGSLSGGQIPSDPCLYWSGTEAGEWHYQEFPIANGSFVQGWNSIDFMIMKTALWHGFSILVLSYNMRQSRPRSRRRIDGFSGHDACSIMSLVEPERT